MFQPVIMTGIKRIDWAQLGFYTQETLFTIPVEQNPLVEPLHGERIISDPGSLPGGLVKAPDDPPADGAAVLISLLFRCQHCFFSRGNIVFICIPAAANRNGERIGRGK